MSGLGGWDTNMRFRSDKSVLFTVSSNVLAQHVEALKGLKIRLEGMDEGTGNLNPWSAGFCYHHGDFHHDFTVEAAKDPKFRKKTSYRYCDHLTFATAA